MREYGFRAVAHRQTGDHREVALQAATHLLYYAKENVVQSNRPCVLKVTLQMCSAALRFSYYTEMAGPTLRAAKTAKQAINLAIYL